MKDICAVIVTYNPAPIEVETLIERIADHVGMIVIVDNGSRNVDALRSLPARLIELGNNKGVAAAQNVGIRLALERDFRFIILFDQDSLPMPDMVQNLRTAYDHMTMQGVRVAAVGPNYIERNSGIDHPTLDGIGRNPIHRYARLYESIIRTDMIIASGCLISCEALRDVGLMDEALFIDHVDIEWCLRAVLKWREGKGRRIETERSWKIYVACDATMGHTLGDGMKRFWFGKPRMLPIKPPMRYYYIVRNAVYLIKSEKDFPRGWKRAQRRMVIGALAFAVLGFFPDHYLARIYFIVLGIWDGLFNNLGAYRAQKEILNFIVPSRLPLEEAQIRNSMPNSEDDIKSPTQP